MTNRLQATLLLALGCFCLAPGSGATADYDAGRAVVVDGEDGSISPCFLCHGLDGAGDSAGAFPRLAGQVAFYMYKQLVDYASGERPNDVMSPIAQAMTDKQMVDVSFYYALSAAPEPRHAPPSDEALLQRGRTIATEGIEKRDILACNICHGENGRGDPPLFPYLAGQHAAYTELQLLLWKEGTRKNDPHDVMADFARAMTVEDIEAVAAWYASLDPPRPVVVRLSGAQSSGAGD